MPALRERPDLDEGQAELYEAFVVLSRGRTQGMGPGGIPVTEMECYCRMHGVEDREKFVRVIAALDAAYLSDVKARLEAQTTATK